MAAATGRYERHSPVVVVVAKGRRHAISDGDAWPQVGTADGVQPPHDVPVGDDRKAVFAEERPRKNPALKVVSGDKRQPQHAFEHNTTR